MTRPTALHVWKFLMKNMIPTNSGLMSKNELKHKHAYDMISPYTH